MHVVVLGAGVAGVTSAYFLAMRGCDVTLVDRAAGPASGTSFANGGQLSYSFTDALARPSFLPKIPGLLLGRDPAIRVRLLSRPPLVRWGLSFLGQCTPRRARDNTVHVLRLALRSAERLRDIREHTGVEFAHAGGGKLVLLPEGSDLRTFRETAELKRSFGCETTLLGMREAEALEPALDGFTGRYAAAIFSARDEVGDARAFAAGLTDWLVAQRSLQTQFSVTATGLRLDGGRVRAVLTDRGPLAADAVVVCLGASSPALLEPLGVPAPVYPVRGYSLTLPCGPRAPAISITDLGRRLLFCPLAGRMRVSGFADFLGDDHDLDAERIGALKRMAAETAPAAADFSAADSAGWAGNRPMTPDGRPLTGSTRVRGLFVNCGHGTLGWTLAAATGHDVAEAVLADERQN